MIIVRFETLLNAEEKLDLYNNLARSETTPIDFNLTDIYKHQTVSIWWFNGTDCIENGGLGKSSISNDIQLQDIIEISTRADLIALGYLPPDPDDNK